MKIVFIASEIAPFAKTGGLADVTGSLPGEIQALGHEVIAFLPRYKGIDITEEGFDLVVEKLSVPIGTERETGKVYRKKGPGGVQFYFIDHPEFYCRDALYGGALGDYADNDVRFIFFQRGVLEALKDMSIAPDVIHCHDWQTGLLPIFLKTHYESEPLFENTKSVFTIHNLAYQGNFPPDTMPASGLSWEHFKFERLEFYGKMSFMKAGIVYSDIVTTVSESYAKEIQTKEMGCGLEGALKKTGDYVTGILNGIDNDEWNPATDQDISATFSAEDFSRKVVNKEELQKENHLKVDADVPVIGIVTRLVDQKGIDILIAGLDEIAALGAQFVLLGTGEEKYHQMFRDAGKQYRDQFAMHIVFDPEMAKRIYAGSDMMLIPSYYEPCGLAQMIALRYGTVPLVRAVGGLADTIQEFDPKSGEGNGFRFEDYTTRAMMAAIQRALKVYRDKKSWNQLMTNAMACDFSWKVSAEKYVELYKNTERRSLESV